MFGFKLIRRSKIDETELESFRKIVPALSDTVNSLYEFSKTITKESVDESTFDSREYFRLLNSLESHFKVYQENKFAYPSHEIDIMFELRGLERAGRVLTDSCAHLSLVRDAMKLPKDVPFSIGCEVFLQESNDEDEKTQQLVKEISRLLLSAEKTFMGVSDAIRRCCNRITSAIEVDEIRLKTSRDIIKDYYDRKKYAKPGKLDAIAEYKLQFVTKDDRKVK